MTPEQISVITTVLGFLSKWPVWAGMIVIIIVGPWVALIFALRIIERNQERRFNDVVVEMRKQVQEAESRYQNNVKLVEFAERIGSDYKELALMINTALTTLIEMIRNNLYCPLVRRKIKEKDIEIEAKGGN